MRDMVRQDKYSYFTAQRLAMGMQSGTDPRRKVQDARDWGWARSYAYVLILAWWVVASPLPAQATQAASVPLLLPTTVFLDASGVLYVAETNRHVIDRIDGSGVLSVVAGNGIQGYAGDGGVATSAELDSPQGIAVDAAGNLYIADTHNHRVRMVAAGTGIITTMFGTGVAGFSGDAGLGVAARVNLPVALALDGQGHLDVADTNNHRIRQLTLATGIVRTVAGNGTQGDAGDGGLATAGSIDTPSGLAADAAGDVYLADTHNHRVRMVAAATGIITTVSPSASAASLLRPRGLSLDAAGNLYVADSNAQRVFRIAPDGTLTEIAGTGTQGFAGDGGAATAALLDRPRSAAVSSAGLITVADTGNQRVRQLAEDGTIQTFGGIGVVGPAALSLASPSVVQYGTGVLSATLVPSGGATGLFPGNVSFFEVANNLLKPLGTGALSANAAVFSTAKLAAGLHQIVATYAGDASHSAAQSSVVALTVTPAPIAAVPMSVTVLYGQAAPVLTGTLTGLLPQDAGLVSAVFSAGIQGLASPGSYPIGVMLTGAAAGNYQVMRTAAALLTIAQAPSATSLTASAASALQGSSVTLAARAAATTSGIPTGRMTFLDSGVAMGSSLLDASGGTSLAASLGVGTHSVTAAYTGDGNFLPSVSGAVSATIVGSTAASPDFTLAASGSAAQTAAVGEAATYSFTVAVQNGPLNSPILLTASGMPAGATATFSPAYLPPGGAVSAFTLTVQTAKTTAQTTASPGSRWAMWLSLGLLPLGFRRKRFGRCLAVVLMIGSAAGCGDRVTTLPSAQSAAAQVYPLTVTGTSTLTSGTTVQHAVAVTLTVQ